MSFSYRTQVHELLDVPQVYDDLMNLIVRLGNSGVIHGDFNEFNLMLTDDGKPILIDFPQMMSTAHENAQLLVAEKKIWFNTNVYPIHGSFFDRDVTCVREMFRRKFGYESEDYPKFSDLVREDDLDAEVHCTGYGFTKEMEQDLLQEYGMIDEVENAEEETNDEPPTLVPAAAAEIDECRRQLENEVSYSESKPTQQKSDDAIRRYIESCTQYLGNLTVGPEVSDHALPTTPKSAAPEQESSISTSESNKAVKETADLGSKEKEATALADDAHSISSNDLETDEMPELAGLDPNSRMYRLKMVEQMLNDARSQRSYSTTASTIAPSVITDRIRRNMDVKEKRDQRKRCVAKGEASAVHRHRKENKDVVKEYAGWDF